MVEKEQLHILVIEDDEDDYFLARRLLSKARGITCSIDWAQTYDEGLERITAREYDVALIDYRLDAQTGIDLLREALQQGCETPMVLLTGQGDLRVDLEAMAAGAADYLVKGQIDAQLLERSIRYARERKRADVRIRDQAQLLDKARDAISAFDLEGRVIYWNKSAEETTGYRVEEVEGKRIGDKLYAGRQDTLQEVWEHVLSEGEWIGELQQTRKDGRTVVVESRWTLVRDAIGNPKSVLVIHTDITERKELETQFLRSQRMESIGTLVGGIAHDLGNLLVPVLLGVQVLEKRFEGDPSTTRTLQMISRSAQRGADMVKQVLAFARGVEGERVPMNPGQVIREIERISLETFPREISFMVEVPDDVWKIKGDATQIQQVLMNLTVNARDAMPDGGRISVTLENVDVGKEHMRTNIEAKLGPHVCITVTDTGEGIPPEVRDKMFEPFYTTKPVGKGTGLGLSTVYSIVKSHNGFVNVHSHPGQGTTFRIFIPATVESLGHSPDLEETDGSANDTGEGIPPEVRDKMFEPFYTTKPVGKGTGLGLSTVYSIVKSHNGFVNVHSHPGQGTTFRIFIPATVESLGHSPDLEETDGSANGNGELVMVVDDEEFILELARETLESAGYHVVTAKDGHEALNIFDRRKQELHAIITDLMMPNLDGVATIRELKARGAGMPIIAASGASGDRAAEAIKAGAELFLSKPFTATKLCRVLKDVLHSDSLSDV